MGLWETRGWERRRGVRRVVSEKEMYSRAGAYAVVRVEERETAATRVDSLMAKVRAKAV